MEMTSLLFASRLFAVSVRELLGAREFSGSRKEPIPLRLLQRLQPVEALTPSGQSRGTFPIQNTAAVHMFS